MAGTPRTIYEHDAVAIGPLSIPTQYLRDAIAQEFTQGGVVLENERVTLNLKVGDMPVAYKLSLYITREPIGNEEAAKVTDVKQLRAADKKKKEREEEEKLAREKRAAFELGQEATIGTMRNLNVLASAAKALSKLAD